MHFSVSRKDLKCTKKLLKGGKDTGTSTGANPNIQDAKEQTALHYAAIGQEPELVKALLKYDADPSIKDNRGKTALHYSAKEPELVKALLKYDADPNIQDNKGKTALHYSAKKPETLKMLLQAGADPNIKDNDGKTVFDYMNQRTQKTEKQYLEAACENVDKAVHDIAKSLEILHETRSWLCCGTVTHIAEQDKPTLQKIRNAVSSVVFAPQGEEATIELDRQSLEEALRESLTAVEGLTGTIEDAAGVALTTCHRAKQSATQYNIATS